MRNQIPLTTNTILALFFLGVNIVQFFVIPVFLLPDSPYWALLLVPVVLSTTTYWALMHEAVHGVLFPSRTTNDLGGRVFSVTFGAPFDVLKFGHIMHHRYNRTDLDQSEVYKQEKSSSFLFAASYYFRLLVGLYVAELVSNLLVFLPRNLLHRLAHKQFATDEEGERLFRSMEGQVLQSSALWKMRLEALSIFALFGVSFYLYGSYWFFLLLALMGRGFMISFFDNAYHYGTPLYDVHYSYNLKLPSFVSLLILHFDLHRVHHRHPSIPWSQLPRTFAENDGVLDGGYFSKAFRQLRGPITEDSLQNARHGDPGTNARQPMPA